MLFYIIYHTLIDETIFKLWLNHYKRLDIEYKIFVEKQDITNFNTKFPFSSTDVIDFIPLNLLKLTEMDFLFSYSKDAEDNMILSYKIDPYFPYKSLIIGKVFYVPVKTANKTIYTTFEIPDFILYRHADHTNYTKDGIVLNGGNQLSHNIVCLNLNVSPSASENEYFETDILIHSYNTSACPIFNNIYNSHIINVNVNKEHKYGIIWHPKCGCTTITHIFCLVNNIGLTKEKQKSLSFYLKKYRYNCYLQNIDFISFERNPFHRFISTFLDKHVYKSDNIFITLNGYHEFMHLYKVETMENICDFLLNGKYISDHYTLASMCDIYTKCNKKTMSNSVHIVKIESAGLNAPLYDFLKKYHTANIDLFDIANKFENVRDNKSGKKEFILSHLNVEFQRLNTEEWKKYLNEYNVDYDFILNSAGCVELKKKLQRIYSNDFELFGY